MAQVTEGSNTGYPTNGLIHGSDIENVQLNQGNLHIDIPLYSIKGRNGLDTTVRYIYDNHSWIIYQKQIDAPFYVKPWGIYAGVVGNGNGSTDMQWTASTPFTVGVLHGGGVAQYCPANNQYYSYTSGYVVMDPNGTRHSFGAVRIYSANQCGDGQATNQIYALDGSGWMIKFINWTQVAYVSDKHGNHWTWDSSGNPTMTDPNGNQLKGSGPVITDTLGRSLPGDFTFNSANNDYELTYNDSNGNPQTIKMMKANVTISTSSCGLSDGSAPCTEYTGTWSMVSQILLPNGLKYTFNYYQNAYGEPSSITLPTGATISYTFGSTDDGGRRVLTRTVTSNGESSPWTYTYNKINNQAGNVIEADPYGNQTQIFFTHPNNWPSVPSAETERDIYTGSLSGGSLMKKVLTDLESYGPYLPIRQTTIWPQFNLYSKTETDWDQQTYQGVTTTVYGTVVEKREFSYGLGAPGALARKTHYNYAHLSGNTNYNVNYANLNIADLVTEKQVFDASGNKYSDSIMYYDQSIVSTTSGVPNHDYTVGTYRGNLTQSSQWLNTTNSWPINTTNAYNDLGHVISTTDPGGHTTTFSYADSWSGSSCGVGTNTQAFLTQTQAPDTVNQQGNTVHHRLQTSYYACTGQKQSTRDENDILASRTGTTLTYDLMERPLNITRSDGGQTNYSYTDVPNSVSITSSQLMDTNNHQLVSVSVYDGFGRITQKQLSSDPEGTVYVNTTYDLLGREASVSNPFRSSSEPTYGVTTYGYDALNRLILEIPPDGKSSSNNIVTSYGAQTTGVLGLTTTVTDQAGKRRMSVTDALSHLVDVWEPDSSNNLVNETAYVYDPLNNLVQVTQKGNSAQSQWRIRSFNYDSLSRLTTASNPESGTITYRYDNAGNVISKTAPAPNQIGTSTVSISYGYDADNRLTQKTYSDTTPTVQYAYDGSSLTGCTVAPPILTDSNPVEYRTAMCDSSGATSWSHDSVGRILQERRKIGGSAGLYTTYAYNLDGSLASLTDVTGRAITYTYSSAGRALTAQSPGLGINYVKNATYAPFGGLTGMTHGSTSTFGGITVQASYNNRLQPLQMVSTTGTALTASDLALTSCPTTVGNTLHLVYGFSAGMADNGNVVSIANCRDSNRTQNFQYDNLNRIKQAYTSGPNWGETFTIDAWGNLTNRGPVSGKVNYESLNAAPASVNNQLNGYCHDSAGNLVLNSACPTGAFSPTYSYDAENRLASTGGVTYTYDGDGRRVQKSNGTLYWNDISGDALAESDLSANMQSQYIFFDGKRVARRDVATNAVHYYFSDHLGSTSIITDATGSSVQKESDYYPYGGEIPISGSDPNHYKFTGKERDSETGLDNFGIRYFGSSMGRFMSPDSIANDWELANPQTWNRYAYARNNPLIFVDPDGAAVELIGDEEQRKKELALLQKSVGNQDAANRLYINEVKDGDNTRYFVGIKGDVGDFMKLSETSHDLANVVQDKQVVEFGLTNKDLTQFGGAVTYDKGEAGNQNVRVLVNPDQMGVADRNLNPATILGFGRWAGQNQDSPWRVRPFTPGIATWHEFGHAWGNIHGRTSHRSDQEANAWENRMRQQVYGPFGPDNAKRIAH